MTTKTKRIHILSYNKQVWYVTGSLIYIIKSYVLILHKKLVNIRKRSAISCKTKFCYGTVTGALYSFFFDLANEYDKWKKILKWISCSYKLQFWTLQLLLSTNKPKYLKICLIQWHWGKFVELRFFGTDGFLSLFV